MAVAENGNPQQGPTTDYVLICAPGGCGFKQAVEKLLWVLRAITLRDTKPEALKDVLSTPAASSFRRRLEESDHWDHLRDVEETVSHQDVEDALCGLPGATGALRDADSDVSGRPNMRDVTWGLTRDHVIQLWQEALDMSLHSLSQAEWTTSVGRARTLPLRVLSCHLTLYGGRRREFYSPIAIHRLLGNGRFKPTHVLLLIDDVYDMYTRLTAKGHLYDEEERTGGYLAQIWDEEGNHGEEAFEDRLRARLALEWKVGVLTALLAWRRSEMVFAESLARQVGANYIVLGTKQNAEIAAKWLMDREPRSVYLSHPISRPRRFYRDQGAWPLVVGQFNELQGRLARVRPGTSGSAPLCVMPTAIDEYRIRRGTQKPLSLRHLALEARWPSHGGTAVTLYSLPHRHSDHEHTGIFESDPRPSKEEADRLLRQLENQIKFEVPFRDHHLVVCNPGLLVFRPLYEEGRMSSGVKAELEHWKALARRDDRRRAVLIHFVEDIVLVVGEPELENEIRRATIKILMEDYHLPEDAAVKVESGAKVRPTLLDAGQLPNPSKAQREFPRVLRRAQLKVMWSKLTVVDLPRERTAVWIFGQTQELYDGIETIGAFLLGEVNAMRDSVRQWENVALELVEGAC